MGSAEYPLEQIATIKQKRLEEAEKTLREKKLKLEEEKKRLVTFEEKRNEVLKHKNEKIRKHLEEVSQGTTSREMEIHQRYIKEVVEEELKEAEKKVVSQKKVVTQSEEDVEKARKEYIKKNQDVEKIKMHRKEWDKEAKMQEIRDEALETEELGTNIHSRKRHTKFYSNKHGKKSWKMSPGLKEFPIRAKAAL